MVPEALITTDRVQKNKSSASIPEFETFRVTVDVPKSNEAAVWPENGLQNVVPVATHQSPNDVPRRQTDGLRLQISGGADRHGPDKKPIITSEAPI